MLMRMPPTDMKRSERFEKWFSEYCELDVQKVADMWDGYTYQSYAYNVEIAWAAWIEACNL